MSAWQPINSKTLRTMPEWAEVIFSENDPDPLLTGQDSMFKYIALYGDPASMFWRPASLQALQARAPYSDSARAAIARAEGR